MGWRIIIIVFLFNTACGEVWVAVSRPAAHSVANAVVTIAAGGVFTSYSGVAEPYVASLQSSGALTPSFAPSGSGLNAGGVLAIGVDAAGGIIAGGGFSSYNGTSTTTLARLTNTGALDTTFNFGGAGLDGNVLTLYIESDQKIMIGGWFTHYNGTVMARFARLNTDGTLDSTFNPAANVNSDGKAIIQDSSNRYLVGGNFTAYGATPENYIARLNNDGTLDTTFAPTGAGLDNDVLAFAIDSSGKIYAGGGFTTYAGISRSKIVRLNTDGTLDGAFAPGSGFSNNVQAMTIDPSGKILVGGNFTFYNGAPVAYIVRLNTDGSLDATFNSVGTGLNNQVTSIFLDPTGSGKIYVGGQFTAYNGTPLPYVGRLNSDGSLDPTFAAVGAGINGLVNAISFSYTLH